MNPLAIFALATLVFIGFLFGVALCLLLCATYLLHTSASRALAHTTNAEKNLTAIISRNTLQVERLESQVTAALSRVDASAMFEASQLIQRTQRQFARTTDQFMKLLYSQEGAAQIAAEEAQAEMDSDLDPDAAGSAFPAFNPRAYSDHLRQRAAERAAAETLATQMHKPPLDPDEAWRMQEEEDLVGGPLA